MSVHNMFGPCLHQSQLLFEPISSIIEFLKTFLGLSFRFSQLTDMTLKSHFRFLPRGFHVFVTFFLVL